MIKSLSPSYQASDGPLDRAQRLAARMAKVVHGHDVADVSLAVALLTSGLVHQYAESLPVARDLIKSIRCVEDQMIKNAFEITEPIH